MMRITLFFCVFVTVASAFSTHKPGKKFKAPKEFVYVPSGVYEDQNQAFTVNGFFIRSKEVSNLEYREFLASLKQSATAEDYEKARIRPEGWKLLKNNVLSGVYHEHPAYDDYPVTNITREAAEMYCQWLTEKLKDQYPDFKFKVRLPLEKEWMYAAQAGHKDAPYPHGYYLRNGEGKSLYCFKALGDEFVHQDEKGLLSVQFNRDSSTLERFLSPMPTKSNSPNDYGIYNICGNVAEMVKEEGHVKGGSFNDTGYDIRIDAPAGHLEPGSVSPFVGFRVLLTVVGE